MDENRKSPASNAGCAANTRKKKVGQKARELRPRQILQAMGAQGPITMAEVKKLAEQKYSNAVISLYLSLDEKKVAPEPSGWVRAFHSQKTRVLRERKEFVDSLSKRQKETLDHDLKEIEEFLKEVFMPQNFHSLAILRSGGELNRVIKFGVHIPEALVIDPDPYIEPLEAVLESAERVLFVEVSKSESRFDVYQLGISSARGATAILCAFRHGR
ncbi:MAG TPA: hypothetical protein VGF61_23470 [Candidatus Acidoferrum sp.]